VAVRLGLAFLLVVVFCRRCTTTVGTSTGPDTGAPAGAAVLGCGVLEGVLLVEVLAGC